MGSVRALAWLERHATVGRAGPIKSILRKQGLGVPLNGIVGDGGLEESSSFILICVVDRSLSARDLFFPRLLRPPRQPGHVFGRQTPGRPKQIGHFPRPLANDVG